MGISSKQGSLIISFVLSHIEGLTITPTVKRQKNQSSCGEGRRGKKKKQINKCSRLGYNSYCQQNSEKVTYKFNSGYTEIVDNSQLPIKMEPNMGLKKTSNFLPGHSGGLTSGGANNCLEKGLIVASAEVSLIIKWSRFGKLLA